MSQQPHDPQQGYDQPPAHQHTVQPDGPQYQAPKTKRWYRRKRVLIPAGLLAGVIIVSLLNRGR